MLDTVLVPSSPADAERERLSRLADPSVLSDSPATRAHDGTHLLPA